MRTIVILTLAIFALSVAPKSIYEPENIEDFYRDDDEDRDFGNCIKSSEDDSEDSDDSDESEDGGTGWRLEKYRWPKKSQRVSIPYEIDDKTEYTSEHKANMRKAMELIEAETCVRFIKRTDEPTYLFITKESEGCWSYVGYRSEMKAQTVNFSQKCAKYVGHMAHELIHALGFFHMHSHPDRNKYVKIHFDNIAEKNHKDYKIVHKLMGTNFDTPYDYFSIMHYGRFSYAIDKKKPTMEALIDPEVNNKLIGQYEVLSPGDMIRINTMYSCNKGLKRSREEEDSDVSESSESSEHDESEKSDESEVDSDSDESDE